MPFNGSGSYSPPSASYPINNGTLGDADQVTAIFADVATALSNCVVKDGQQTITANVPMNGFKLTGVGPGLSRTDSATIANLQENTGIFVPNVGGTANAITLSPSPAIAAYAVGQRFVFLPGFDNTGSVTVAVSGLAPKDLQVLQGGGAAAGDLRLAGIAEIVYDGTRFLLMGGGVQTQRNAKILNSCVLSSCTVAAPPTLSLGVANKGYVDSSTWTTGDVKVTLKTIADSGWVMFDDGTIGSASSGATTRANADTEDLFTLLWTNTTNANCAVSGGRGVSAAADFAANKTIALPKVLGRALAVAGAGSGLTSRALAVALGAENAITVSHTHTATDSGHTHQENATNAGGGSQIGIASNSNHLTAQTTNISTASGVASITVSTTGSSGIGANMQPTTFLNIMVKL